MQRGVHHPSYPYFYDDGHDDDDLGLQERNENKGENRISISKK